MQLTKEDVLAMGVVVETNVVVDEIQKITRRTDFNVKNVMYQEGYALVPTPVFDEGVVGGIVTNSEFIYFEVVFNNKDQAFIEYNSYLNTATVFCMNDRNKFGSKYRANLQKFKKENLKFDIWVYEPDPVTDFFLEIAEEVYLSSKTQKD